MFDSTGNFYYGESLYHHGVKGMKWGVRRYQNPDGSLTAKGKKRYYDKSGNLTKKGIKFNKEQEDKFQRTVKSVKANAEIMNKNKISEAKRDLKKLHKENSEQYMKERDKWIRQEGEYKDQDYYAFKDIAADKWFTSESGKREVAIDKALREYYSSAAKEHPMYNKMYRELRHKNLYSPDTMIQEEYGKKIVNSIMNELRLEIIQSEKLI